MATQKVSATAEIHPSVVFGPNCESITIGHGTRIYRDTYIDVRQLTIGDYVTIHHGGVIHGDKISIGHNTWIGHMAILDGHGGQLSIGNNVGIGAQSQIWSHMKFGDTLAGCRWHKMGSTTLEDDVWLVGHCIVTPIHAHRRSMLMVGGVITKDMAENHVYAGSPARDMTEVFGPQFAATTPEQRLDRFQLLIEEFADEGNDIGWIRIRGINDAPQAKETVFDPTTMTYAPQFSDTETEFMRFLLYDRAKFLPISDNR